MVSDAEFEAKIREMAEWIRANTQGTETEKDIAVIRGLVEFNVRGLHEVSKRVKELERKLSPR